MSGIESCRTIVTAFLTHNMTASDFCDQFAGLWADHRDEVLKQAEAWPERFDLQLIEAFRVGEISREQFTEQYSKLWVYPHGLDYQRAIDSIHSSCMIYSEHPEQEWEISEDQLRAEVSEAWTDPG